MPYLHLESFTQYSFQYYKSLANGLKIRFFFKEHLHLVLNLCKISSEEVKTMSNLLKKFENRQLKQDGIPTYHPGDTVEVKLQITEGTRVRVQAFLGVVIKKRDRGISTSLTLRKISNGVGVERTFNVHSPLVKSIDVKRHGKVRQAKLYYIRDLTAKKARIAEKRKVVKVKDEKSGK